MACPSRIETPLSLTSDVTDADDWMLVPRKPTKKMIHALRALTSSEYGNPISFRNAEEYWEVMIKAAPHGEVSS